MGRTPCCEKSMGLKKGPWTPDEDEKLVEYIKCHGHGSWRALPKRAGLLRCGKSCRLRWTNYLRPDIKRGKFSIDEERTIIELHAVLGNKWSTIAAQLPGRTDNEIKNYWNTHLKKRLLHMGIDPVTHRPTANLLGLPSVSSPFNRSALSDVQHWENARLAAATAECLRQALFLSSDKGFNPSSDLCVRPNEQYSLPWIQQQPGMTLDFKGLPHNLKQLLHTQTTESATSNTKYLEQPLVQCQNIGYYGPLNNSIYPIEYGNGSNVAGFTSPCSTLTSMEGLHKKTQMLFHNQDDVLTKHAVVDLGEGDMNIDFKKVANHKPNVSFDQDNNSYNNNNGNQSCSEPTTTLWAACQNPLQLVGSSNSTYNEAEMVPFISSTSMENNNENKSYEGEVRANEAGAKEYWSKVLKAVGLIPASHIITAQQ